MITVSIATSDVDFQDVLAIRRRVFVDEQNVPESLEIDEHEQEATFFIARDGAQALGTGRFRIKGPYLKFERIATVKEARGRGIGRRLMAVMEAAGEGDYPRHLRYMHAQMSAVGFYEKLGWSKVGDGFHEAGIVHQTMIKPPLDHEGRARLLVHQQPQVDAHILDFIQNL